MTERKMIKINVCCVESGYPEWPSKKASQFIEWISERLAEIPAEHRDTAEINITALGYYDSDNSSEINIDYYRPETDAEMAARIDLEERRRRIEKEREIRLLNLLKAKYEGDAK